MDERRILLEFILLRAIIMVAFSCYLKRESMSVDLTSQNRLAYPLLATRFFLPPLPVGCVPRPRLMERLNLGLHVPLTLISAPPGFGKSALIRQWIHHHTVDDQQNLTAGWLSLEPSDTDFGFFFGIW